MPSHPTKAWFAPKRFGYGAGLPLAWQGWALVGALVAVVVLSVAELTGPATIAIALALFAAVARKTEGGWRWRGKR